MHFTFNPALALVLCIGIPLVLALAVYALARLSDWGMVWILSDTKRIPCSNTVRYLRGYAHHPLLYWLAIVGMAVLAFANWPAHAACSPRGNPFATCHDADGHAIRPNDYSATGPLGSRSYSSRGVRGARGSSKGLDAGRNPKNFITPGRVTTTIKTH